MSEHYNNLAVYSVFFFLMFTVNIFLCFLPVPSYFLKTDEVFSALGTFDSYKCMFFSVLVSYPDSL